MFPTGFDEETGTLESTDPAIVSSSVYTGKDESGTKVCISCFKATKEELEEINKTKRVWVVFYQRSKNFYIPPYAVSGVYPFVKKETPETPEDKK